ncbi:MAG: electron transfer flavoprotein subunit beta/FixA family protein [Peptococcaceae bacterium]|jgi:electron transfer flavoprotein beta subunit|nr:electron transfer flavoprotein subunit beta/FixA family protein [Peptococcaceae bacterium]
MHIIVLVKQVPATDNVRMDEKTGTMIRAGSDSVVNPTDENAVTEAVRLKKEAGATVTALSMGPEAASRALREAYAMGVDRCVLLSGRAFAGSDTIATARALAAAVRKAGPVDLVLAGERATDGETGQTGPMVGALLGLPVITYAQKLVLGEGGLEVERLVEGGFERMACPLPALVTVVKGINHPVVPSLHLKLRAKKLDIPQWGAADLEVPAGELGLNGSPTRVARIFSPKLSRNTVWYRENGGHDGLTALADWLTGEGLI